MPRPSPARSIVVLTRSITERFTFGVVGKSVGIEWGDRFEGNRGLTLTWAEFALSIDEAKLIAALDPLEGTDLARHDVIVRVRAALNRQAQEGR